MEDFEQSLHREIDAICCGRALQVPHRQLFQDAIRNSIQSKTDFEQLLHQRDPQEQFKRDTLFDVFSQRRSDLENFYRKVQPRTISCCHLAEFDYAVRVNVANSSVCGIKQPLVALQLKLAKVDGTSKDVTLELDRTQLAQLVKEFGEIDKVLTEIDANSK